MNIPRVRGTARIEVYVSQQAKDKLKKFSSLNSVHMKDIIDHLIMQHLPEAN